MADFLTEKAVFKCSQSLSAEIIATDPVSNVKYKDSVVLTQNAILKLSQPSAPCNLSPDKICKFPTLTGWLLRGADKENLYGGAPLLTDRTEGNCPLLPAGIITLKSHKDTAGKFLHGRVTPASNNKSDQDSSKDGDKKSASEKENDKKSTNLKGDEIPKNKVLSAEELEILHDPAKSRVLKCNTDKCPNKDKWPTLEIRKEKCDALKELGQTIFNNDSSTLGNNYRKQVCGKCKEIKSKCAVYAEMTGNKTSQTGNGLQNTLKQYPQCGKVEPEDNTSHDVPLIVDATHKAHKAFIESVESLNDNGTLIKWNHPAHHIISGNDVASRNPDLLALIKAFDYDINCADNCIMLAGAPRRIGLGKAGESEKHIHKFECMAHSKLQWHGGGHSYGKSLQEYKEKIKEGMRERKCSEHEHAIQDYVTLALEKVSKLVNKYKGKPVCPQEDKKRRKWFINSLNKIADEIRQALTSFNEKPHHSAPWFVSLDAWLYAFSLPRTSKVIAVARQNNGDLLLKKLTITRYGPTLEARGKNIAIKGYGDGENGKDKDDSPSLLWTPAPENIKECIDFCDKVSAFAFNSDIPQDCLGFWLETPQIFQLHTTSRHMNIILEELNERQSELLEWLWELSEDDNNAASYGTKAERKAEAEAYFKSGRGDL